MTRNLLSDADASSRRFPWWSSLRGRRAGIGVAVRLGGDPARLRRSRNNAVLAS